MESMISGTKIARREAQIVRPITITAVNWSPPDDDGERVITGVYLSYKYVDESWGIVSGGPWLGKEPVLAYSDERLFHNFIRLGLQSGISAKLDELSENPEDNYQLVLESGTLAELLRYGIGPSEAWTFLVNHGGARRKSTVLLDLDAPDPSRGFMPREIDPWLKPQRKRELLKASALRCSQAARALRRLQSAGMSEAVTARGTVRALNPFASGSSQTKVIQPAEARTIGPLNALPRESTDALIAELEKTAAVLQEDIAAFRLDRQRPDNPDAAAFCHEWHRLAMERAGRPAYALGAKLYSLVFAKMTPKGVKSVTPESFKRACIRATKE